MLDQEIIEALATKVMGWKVFPFETSNDALDGLHFWGTNKTDVVAMYDDSMPWNPLESDSDNAMILDRMAEETDGCVLQYEPKGPDRTWCCSFHDHYAKGPFHDVHSKDRRWAICMCALKAAGVEF